MRLSKGLLPQVPSRDRPSTVIAFAQKTFKDGNLTSKLHVIELGAPAGAGSARAFSSAARICQC